MNVGELIAILQRFPPDLRAVVDGYEGDGDDIKAVRSQPIIAFGNTEKSPTGMGKTLKPTSEMPPKSPFLSSAIAPFANQKPVLGVMHVWF